MKNAQIKNSYILILLLISTCICGQSKIWSSYLKQNIVYNQKIQDDSIILIINKSENKWLEKNVIIKTVNYWDNAPIEFSTHVNKNSFYIKRSFLSNNIVGDLIFFKKNKKKYHYSDLKEFEQKEYLR